jgi:hypothetical protein
LSLSPPSTAGEVKEELFTVNFTINNLRYSADMGNHGSLKFNITGTLMQHLVSSLLPSTLQAHPRAIVYLYPTLVPSFLSSSALCSRGVAWVPYTQAAG